jgi:hypothetical protein
VRYYILNMTILFAKNDFVTPTMFFHCKMIYT